MKQDKIQQELKAIREEIADLKSKLIESGVIKFKPIKPPQADVF